MRFGSWVRARTLEVRSETPLPRRRKPLAGRCSVCRVHSIPNFSIFDDAHIEHQIFPSSVTCVTISPLFLQPAFPLLFLWRFLVLVSPRHQTRAPPPTVWRSCHSP